jgi:O-6-methylguanine DNA methyltransferase
MAAEVLYRSVIRSPLGPLTLLMSTRGARAVQYGDVPGPAGALESPANTAALARQLEEYFDGTRRDFDVALDPQGTLFQREVWKALRAIPYGATASYKQIAHRVGRPQAYRAVGGANRSNPLAIIVPCHRVVGVDGGLVGYSGKSGIPKKIFLLQLEQGIQG